MILTSLLLTGCANRTGSFRRCAPINGEYLWQSCSNQAAVVATCGATRPEHQWLKFPDDDHAGGLSWTLEHPPPLRLIVAGTGSAPETPAADSSGKERLFSKDYWKLLGQDVKEVFTAPARWDTTDWLVFSGVTAGIVTLGVFDEDIQKAVQRNRTPTTDDIFKAVQPFGAEYAAAVLGGFYLGGELLQNPEAKAVALDGLSASLIASGLVDLPLKYAVGRNRPGADHGAYRFEPFSGNDSFPSGHSTEAFAVATVIAEHYDSVWVTVPAYGVATMVGYARIQVNAHWASDVLAGAALGSVVGHIVVHYNQHHRGLTIAPLIGPHLQGVQLSWSF